MRTRRLVACIGLLALISAGSFAIGRSANVAAATSALTVVGNHFVDNGNVVVLRGVNRSGSEYMCTSGGALTFDGPSDDVSIAAMASWNINVVRVPLNEDCWLGVNGYPASMTSAAYQQAIVGYVNRLHTHGMYAILDLHWNAPGTQPSSGQQVMADADHSPAFWTSVATTFKADLKVVFDLYNEPHGISWACLRDGCMSGFQTAGMQSLVNAVRATGATQPILAGGLAYSNDLSQWLSFKPNDSQLAASLHTYNFNSCATQSCWASTVLPVAGSVPVVAGELGEDDCAHGYIDGFMNWADANGIGYLGWAWNTYDCSNFPSLISNFDGTPTNFGIGFKNHLLAGMPALPTIASVTPNNGPTGGGTSVTITGTNFTGATAVNFGTTAAASFLANSATQITATSPAGSGTVDVRVTTGGGTSAISASDGFTYSSTPSAGWQSLGGMLTSGSDASSWGANRVDVFMRGTDNAMYQNTWNGTAWSGWSSQGGYLTSSPGAVSWSANRIDAFVRGADNQLYHKFWVVTGWSGWEPLGGVLTSGPVAASWAAGRLDVFVRGTDNGLWHKYWDGSRWNGWEGLGGVLTSDPGTVSWGPNRIDIVVRGTDNAIWIKTWNGGWSGWSSLGGGAAAAPDITSCSSGHFDIFIRGPDNALYQRSWSGASWTAWKSLGGNWTTGPAAVCRPGTGIIDLFAAGTDNALWHTSVAGS